MSDREVIEALRHELALSIGSMRRIARICDEEVDGFGFDPQTPLARIERIALNHTDEAVLSSASHGETGT